MSSQSQPPIPPAAGLHGTPGSPESPVSAFSADSAPSADSGPDAAPLSAEDQEGVITIQDTPVIDATAGGTAGDAAGATGSGLGDLTADTRAADPLGDGSYDAGRTVNPLSDGGYGGGGDVAGETTRSDAGGGAGAARDFNAGDSTVGSGYADAQSERGLGATGGSGVGSAGGSGATAVDLSGGTSDQGVPVEPIPPVSDPGDDPVVAAAADDQGVAPADARDDPESYAADPDHDGDRLHDPRT